MELARGILREEMPSSWAYRVKCGGAKKRPSKKVQWKSGGAGVETRSYICEGGQLVGVGFSQITTQDGKDNPKNIFGTLVSNFIDGTKNELGVRENKFSMRDFFETGKGADFFKTGKGAACVVNERIGDVFEEVLKIIRNGGTYFVFSGSFPLEKGHALVITILYMLYKKEREVFLEKVQSTLNPCAQEFHPTQMLEDEGAVLVRCSAKQRLTRQWAVRDDSKWPEEVYRSMMKGRLTRQPSW